MKRKEERKLINKIEKQSDILWRDIKLKQCDYKCEICGNKANQVHHFFPKGQNGHLRYDLDNAVSICQSCHFKHHHTFDPTIHGNIIKIRGNKWYKKLENKSKLKPSSFKNLKWYQNNLKILLNKKI